MSQTISLASPGTGVDVSFSAKATTSLSAGTIPRGGHHHDTGERWFAGVMGKPVGGYRRLDPVALEKQDYFLDQLHKHGIYANLNLHVSRTFNEADGFNVKDLPRDFRYSKYLLYFEPRMRKLLKEFCREYLTHTNPYRKLRRVDDPGIAMIEITNENAFARKGPQLAALLPEPYRGEFKRQWNAWLKKRYVTTAALRAAWKDTGEPLGDDLAEVGDFSAKLAPWILNQRADFPVQTRLDQPGPRPGVPALKLDIVKASGAIWFQELILKDLSLRKGRRYTLSFWAKADKPRTLYLDVSNQGPNNWRALGLSGMIRVTSTWTHLNKVFKATETSDRNARICFKFGASDVDLTLADVRLRTGAEMTGLPEGQSVEQANVEIPASDWSDAATTDIRRFMVDTEKDFVTEIVTFLKNDLGVKVPITASQITYHAPGVVAGTCDYADIHAYWEHPRFPGRPWDRANWFIPNTAMERVPGRDSLLTRAPWRLLDRPFTLSEWNIPDPNDFGASVVPFAAMTAALQDWDGIFFFTYHSSDKDWYADRVMSYFSFNGQPVKLAMLTACANLYRRGDLKALRTVAVGTLQEHVPASVAMTHRIGIDPKANRPAALKPIGGKRLSSRDGRVVWDATDETKAYVTVNTPATRAVWGLIAGGAFDLGGWKITVGKTFRDYAAVVITSLDGKPLERSTRILVTVVGGVENRNMAWDAKRTTVSDKWGTGPTQVNGIPLRMTFPAVGVSKLYALDGRGARTKEIGLSNDALGVWTMNVGPQHKTLWYELTR